MRFRDWKDLFVDWIDEIERQLCRSAPKKAHKRLAQFKERVLESRRTSELKTIETEFDALLNSQSCFRAAARRSVLADFRMLAAKLEEILRQLRAHREPPT